MAVENEASGKPWQPAALLEDKAIFQAKARELDAVFLDRDGEPMAPGDWIEAKHDPAYTVVAVDAVGPDIRISTTWVGCHIPGHPGWHRVIFGTQVVYVGQAAHDLPAAAGTGIGADDEAFDVLGVHDPSFGVVMFRARWSNVAEAEQGHDFLIAAMAAARQTAPPRDGATPLE